MDRRQVIRPLALSVASLPLVQSRVLADASPAAPAPAKPSAPAAPAVAAPAGPFTLPPLGYPFDALEPHLAGQTMQIHHDKHHAAYVDKLNKAGAGRKEGDGW